MRTITGKWGRDDISKTSWQKKWQFIEIYNSEEPIQNFDFDFRSVIYVPYRMEEVRILTILSDVLSYCSAYEQSLLYFQELHLSAESNTRRAFMRIKCRWECENEKLTQVWTFPFSATLYFEHLGFVRNIHSKITSNFTYFFILIIYGLN